MTFGGLQKNSFIDYPGKVSCVLFVSGCNFDCPYCHNPDLVRGNRPQTASLDEETAYDFLNSRKGLLDGVVISGGEPTLFKDLAPLCERIKRLGYPVKLDTNGSRPDVIKRLIDGGLVDYISMDVKTDPFHYDPLIKKNINPDRILSSIMTIMDSPLTYEFRTTCVKPIVDELIIENIVKIIKGAMLYALQRFQKREVLHPEFFSDNEAGYDEDGLMRLKSIAEPLVKRCIIR